MIMMRRHVAVVRVILCCFRFNAAFAANIYAEPVPTLAHIYILHIYARNVGAGGTLCCLGNIIFGIYIRRKFTWTSWNWMNVLTTHKKNWKHAYKKKGRIPSKSMAYVLSRALPELHCLRIYTSSSWAVSLQGKCIASGRIQILSEPPDLQSGP